MAHQVVQPAVTVAPLPTGAFAPAFRTQGDPFLLSVGDLACVRKCCVEAGDGIELLEQFAVGGHGL